MSDTQTFEFYEQGNRLNQLRKHFKLSQKSLSQIVEANQTNVSSVITGRRKIPKFWLLKLSQKYTQLNTDWLMTGDGQMLKDSAATNLGSNTSDKTGETATGLGNGRSLKKDEVEMMLAMIARLSYRVDELEGEMHRLRDTVEQQSKGNE